MNNNNEDVVFDENSPWGPKVQKTEGYKNKKKEICIHTIVKHSYPVMRIQKKYKDRGIKFNLYKYRKKDCYFAKYGFIWWEMISNTFLPITDALNLESIECFEYITKQLKTSLDIISESVDYKAIQKVEETKKNIIKKANAESQKRIRSTVAE